MQPHKLSQRFIQSRLILFQELNMPKQPVTYILLLIVIGTAAFAFTSHSDGDTSLISGSAAKPVGTQKQQEDAYLKKTREARSRFPIANYDEAEPTDPVKSAARKEKQKRYDGPSIVARNPHPKDAEVSSIYEGPELPALPTSQSNVIVVGTVLTGEAHLSHNKKNIYSEFTVQLDDVLKADVSLPPDKILTIDREGGIVSYPNGQQILYRNLRENMPSVGKRYAFFLEFVNQDFRILTAYELDKDKVIPLDDLDQFKSFAGQDVTSFLNHVRTLLSKPKEGSIVKDNKAPHYSSPPSSSVGLNPRINKYYCLGSISG
jgi:hypothetical protein